MSAGFGIAIDLAQAMPRQIAGPDGVDAARDGGQRTKDGGRRTHLRKVHLLKVSVYTMGIFKKYKSKHPDVPYKRNHLLITDNCRIVYVLDLEYLQ